MKKIILCLFAALALTSCNNGTKPKNMKKMEFDMGGAVPVRVYAFKTTHEGHSYIMFFGGDLNGVVHNPDCKCRQ